MKLTRITDPPDAIVRTKFTVTLTADERARLMTLLSRGRADARIKPHRLYPPL